MSKLVRFYGIAPKELDQLTTYEIEMLNRSISIIEAQEILVKLSISDYPNMKKEDRRNYHRKISKIAYPFKDDSDVITSLELARKLSNGRAD